MTGQDNIIELRGVDKSFEDTRALEGIDLSISNGEFLTLLGPSGCGKTTILRILSGFETPDQGDVSIGGQRMNDVPPERRQVNTVFQNYALFPHMTVRDNVAFGLRMQSCPKGEIEGRVLEALRMVHLEQYADRRPHQLSGGQQQRVAIARALVTGPAIICMDEPLSNLDAKLRVQLRNELKKMQRDFGITTIYVTHDQEEALTLSDRIAVFNKGFIEQIGTPNEVYNHSKTEFVCNFIGDINRLEGEVADGLKLDPAQHHFVRLERIRVNRPADDNELRLDGVIESREYYGLYIKYYIHAGSQTIKAIEKNDGINIYEPGEKVTVGIHPVDVMSYDAAPDAR